MKARQGGVRRGSKKHSALSFPSWPHMTLTELVVQAVTALKIPGSRKGISRQAVKKHVGDSHSAAKVKLALKHAVDAGKPKQSKGSFRLAGDAATAAVKAVKKASKAKEAVAAADAKPKKVAAKPKAVKATKAKATKVVKPKAPRL